MNNSQECTDIVAKCKPDPKVTDTADDDEMEFVKLRYCRDLLPVKPYLCRAYELVTDDQVLPWKLGKFHMRLSEALFALMADLVNFDPAITSNADVYLSLYCLDRSGKTSPSYAEFKRFWGGHPLNNIYIILAANKPAHDKGVADLFEILLQERRARISEARDIPCIPEHAIPVCRFNRHQIRVYANLMELDPGAGNRPTVIFPEFRSGWPTYACYPLDPDPCVREDLAAGKKTLRPGMRLISNVKPALRAEIRTWRWELQKAKERTKKQEQHK